MQPDSRASTSKAVMCGLMPLFPVWGWERTRGPTGCATNDQSLSGDPTMLHTERPRRAIKAITEEHIKPET